MSTTVVTTPEDFNLAEFSRSMHASIDDFSKQWLAKHKENPDDYPISMNGNGNLNWIEQFISFLELGGQL